MVWTPQDNVPPSSNFAAPESRNNHLVLDFDPSTIWSALFPGVLPRNYSGNGITVYIAWVAATATSGDVDWGGSFERHDASGLDIDADSFASEKTVFSSAPGTSGQVIYASISFSNGAEIDSLAAGESFRFKLRRVATDAGDTMTGNAQMLRIELKET